MTGEEPFTLRNALPGGGVYALRKQFGREVGGGRIAADIVCYDIRDRFVSV